MKTALGTFAAFFLLAIGWLAFTVSNLSDQVDHLVRITSTQLASETQLAPSFVSLDERSKGDMVRLEAALRNFRNGLPVTASAPATARPVPVDQAVASQPEEPAAATPHAIATQRVAILIKEAEAVAKHWNRSLADYEPTWISINPSNGVQSVKYSYIGSENIPKQRKEFHVAFGYEEPPMLPESEIAAMDKLFMERFGLTPEDMSKEPHKTAPGTIISETEDGAKFMTPDGRVYMIMDWKPVPFN